MTKEQIQQMDNRLIQLALKCAEEGVRCLERSLAHVQLQPNGKASELIGLMYRHEEIDEHLMAIKGLLAGCKEGVEGL